ncbi:STAS domain-containing protein [Reichenbachiella agariperforans]|uniref:STAS domain-containing protein n=1 Tax=Reichenbachiella agariperforans TaxID=156994 RepID=A0A1M6T0P3_REIAG|nr:STAS domain-containing protein [Reichenbachiella agariperforans]SHK50553.1 STAS domain-containing protein [Reichenbachiella agariperforans]
MIESNQHIDSQTEVDTLETPSDHIARISLEPFGNQEDGVTVYLEGVLTLDHVTDIHQKTELALSQFAHVRLVLRAVEAIDLSVVQLLYHLQTLADEGGNSLELIHELPVSMTALIDKSGLKIKLTVE